MPKDKIRLLQNNQKQMNYEQKYNEALERAKSFQEKYGGDYAGYIFPELAESEDERIRKWLLDYFKAVGKSWIHRDITPEQIIAYLEKKKERSEDELTKKHLEGYIMGREDTMREMKDFLESHFNINKAREGEDLTDLYRKEYAQPFPIMPTPPSGWGCDGTHCTNPQMDCINCPRKTTGGGFSTSSGTSTATLHGNTSATDGKEHNPSFTD